MHIKEAVIVIMAFFVCLFFAVILLTGQCSKRDETKRASIELSFPPTQEEDKETETDTR